MRLLLPLGLAALLIAAGCSKDKDVEPPATLVKFPATLPVKKLWGEGVGGGKKQSVLRLGLGPAVDNGVVFAASHKGEVLAASLDTGRHLWVKKLKIPISAGPRAGAGLGVGGSSKGTLVTFDGGTRRGRGGQQQGPHRDFGWSHRARAVALALEFRAAVRSRHRRESRRHSFGRRTA